MACNWLRMNDDKTEIMPVGTKAKLKSVPQTSSLTLSVPLYDSLTKLETWGSILTAHGCSTGLKSGALAAHWLSYF